MLNHKRRWIYSPLETTPQGELPTCRQYAMWWEAPMHKDGFALVYCEMNSHQLEAAKADTTLVVLESLHNDNATVPDVVINKHASHGAKKGMKLKDLLAELAKTEPKFDFNQ